MNNSNITWFRYDIQIIAVILILFPFPFALIYLYINYWRIDYSFVTIPLIFVLILFSILFIISVNELFKYFRFYQARWYIGYEKELFDKHFIEYLGR